jgi:exosome complex RNA-binding protein Rrp4
MAADSAPTDAAIAKITLPFIVTAGEDVTDTCLSVAGGAVRAGDGIALVASRAHKRPASSSSSSAAGEDAEEESLRATKAGVLRFRAPNRFWVEAVAKRYVPAAGDAVVGTVTDKKADSYVIDIRGTTLATLPELAFDGASRRNKPELPIGTLVYARVASVDRHTDAELSCTVTEGPKRDWVTGESLYGELRGGTCVSVDTCTARR